MTTPFRYNKKQRKRYRGQAKAESEVADKLAAKGIDPQIVAAMRTMADINTRLSSLNAKKSPK
jgi:hypothetical protein